MGHLITVGVLLVAIGVTFGALRQIVKQLPTTIRLEMKIAIRDQIDAHLDKYTHDEKEISTVRPAPRGVELQG